MLYPNNSGGVRTIDGTPEWVTLTAADGSLTDTNSLITSWSDSGGWQEISLAAKAAANRYLPSQGPARLDYPAGQFDLSDLVSADGYARKLIKVRLEIDGTSTVPADWYLYAGWFDGSASNAAGGGGRYASSTWDRFVMNYFSGSIGTGGTEPLGSACESVYTPVGPWDGTVNGSTLAVEHAFSVDRANQADSGNWDSTTARLSIVIGQSNTTAFAGTETIRIRCKVAVLTVSAP